MARMVPSPRRADVESEAERLLCRRFEEELPPEYVVVHRARWIGRRRGLEGQDGEADFVLVHPTRGILVLAAKGGVIEVDRATGRWTQRQGDEDRVLDPSPFAEAAASQHALDRVLHALAPLEGRELHLVHAVALPHVVVPPSGLGPGAPRERILDAGDLQALEGWVADVLASAERRRPDLRPLGADGVESVVDALAVRRTLLIHAPTIAAETRAQLATLTDEQFDVLTMLARVPRARVTGGPGTGKTLLAVEAARRFAAQGLDTLLLCFNAPLGGYLARAATEMPGVTAGHFHGICRRFAAEAGLAGQVAESANPEGHEHAFPELLLQAVQRLGRRFDAVVVDEAQDFRETYWAAVEGCIEEVPRGRLLLFEDEQQAPVEGGRAARPAGLVGPLTLTKDCRNPDEIHHFLAACPGGPRGLSPSGVCTGIRPRLRWVEEPATLPQLVASTVARLVSEWGVSPGEIAVLTPRAAARSALGRLDRLGPAAASWRERESERHVLIDTIHRFKGLEATAVVLAEIVPDARPDPATCLCVGGSRPTVHLDLLLPRTMEPVLGGALSCLDVAPPA